MPGRDGFADAAAGEPGAARLGVDPGGQRRLAGIALAGAAEDGEDAVAHELEHLRRPGPRSRRPGPRHGR